MDALEYLYQNGIDKKFLSYWKPKLLQSVAEGKRYNFHCPPEKFGVVNDYFSIYLYGDMVKIVYHKVGIIKHKEKKTKTKSCLSENERFASSVSRAKSKIFELAMCNEFKYFCTFTLDEKKRDRYNLKEFVKSFSMFIRNHNRGRENKIKYLLIPEQHKKGGWHLHGLFLGLTDEDLTAFSLKDNIPQRIKKSIKNGEMVYNWADYQEKFGFFTATKIKDHEACSKYVTKYITKDLAARSRENNAHLFYASQGLKRREPLLLNCFDPCPYDEFDFENDYVKIKTFKLS